MIVLYPFLGCDTSRRHLASLEESRRYADNLRHSFIENKLSIEENLFYSIRGTSSPASVRLNMPSLEMPNRQLAIAGAAQPTQSSPSSPSRIAQESRPGTSRDLVDDVIEQLSQNTQSQLTIIDEVSDEDITDISSLHDDDDEAYVTCNNENESDCTREAKNITSKLTPASNPSDSQSKSIAIKRQASDSDSSDIEELVSKDDKMLSTVNKPSGNL